MREPPPPRLSLSTPAFDWQQRGAKHHRDGPALKMRLRFRGPCWDESPTPAIPPPIPLSASHFGHQEDPLRSLHNLVQSEGLEAACPYRLLRKPQPGSNLSSWSCTSAVKRCWTARDRGLLESEERGGGEDPASASKLNRVRHRCLPSLSQGRVAFGCRM